MRKQFVYKVFHGWAFPEYVTEFKSMKKQLLLLKAREILIAGVLKR